MPALSQSFIFQDLNPSQSTGTSVTYPGSSTTSTFTRVSGQYQGNGYFGSSNGVATVGYTVLPTFVGTCTVQGTLATDPIDVSSTQTDWFDIAGTAIQYNAPGSTTTNYVNFTGNFVWVRGKIDIALGGVQFINYNH